MTAAPAKTTDINRIHPPYRIEAAPLPERYARGWHCLGKASDFT